MGSDNKKNPNKDKKKQPRRSSLIQTLPFQSGIIRRIDGEDCSNTNAFDIHSYRPSRFKLQKKPHLLILVNGMGEFNESVYTGNSGFCNKFREIGVASIFLPLPFHYNRLAEEDKLLLEEELRRQKAEKDRLKHPTIEKIIKEPDRFYLGYEQIKEDIRALMDQITKGIDEGFYPPDTQVSLWGFSIGGLGVLSAFLDQPDLYHSCILVHSGANFVTLGPNEAILTLEQWQNIKEVMLNVQFEEVTLSGKMPSIRRADLERFKLLFLGTNPQELRQLTEKYSHKLLLFIGGSDTVNPLKAIEDTLVPEGGLAVHMLPKLAHDNVNRPFLRWINYEVHVLKAFLDFHPTRS